MMKTTSKIAAVIILMGAVTTSYAQVKKLKTTPVYDNVHREDNFKNKDVTKAIIIDSVADNAHKPAQKPSPKPKPKTPRKAPKK